MVVGFGGDGTLNEVATGIAGSDTALGVLPGGSTNVFARTIGMPNDPVEAVELLAGGIDAADFRPIGLGKVNGRFFCFHTGIGFDAAVVERVERRASLKRWLGHPLFITAGVTTWLTGYDRHTPALPGVAATAAATSTTATSRSCSTPTRTRTSATGRSTCRRPRRSTSRSSPITFTTMSATAILSSLAGALRGGGVKPASHLDIREGVSGSSSSSTTSRSRTRSTVTRSARHPAARVHPRARRGEARVSARRTDVSGSTPTSG